MAIDISNLTILEQRSPEIYGKFVRENLVLRYFVGHTGYNPGTASIRLYEAAGELGECCTHPDNGGTFDERKTEVVCIKVGFEFCQNVLSEALNDFQFRYTAGGESVPTSLEQLFAEQELAKVAQRINRLVFQGDVASADNNLNKLDGLIKQGEANAPAANVFTSTAPNLYSAIVELISRFDPYGYDMGGYDIYVPRAAGVALRTWMISLNNQYISIGTQGVNDEFDFPGYAGIRIIPTSGLDGTNKIIATPRTNVHWLTNLENDWLTYKWDYNNYHDVWFWYLRFLLGVTFGWYDYVYVMTITDAQLTAPIGFPVSVVSPIGTAGGVLTEVTP